jgi:hypothetical protein
MWSFEMQGSIDHPAVFRAIPTFFRALCYDARRGGSASYSGAGHELYRHAEGLLYGGDWEEQHTERQRLDDLVEAGDDAAVIRWFELHFPNCMKLVPRRRRQAFLTGVYRFAE